MRNALILGIKECIRYYKLCHQLSFKAATAHLSVSQSATNCEKTERLLTNYSTLARLSLISSFSSSCYMVLVIWP